MSEHTLEFWTLEHPIRSPPRDQVDSGLNELGNHHRIAVLSIETNQSRLCCESEVRQVGFDGLKRRSQFSLIVAIPSIPIRADPLAGMQRTALWCCLACSIHIKDNVMASLSIPQATNGFRSPSFWKAELLEKGTKGF